MRSGNQEELDEYYRLFFRGNRLYETYARTHGTTLQALFMLRLLEASPEGLSQRDICESLSLPKQTVSRVLAALEREGRASYVTPEADGRQKLWSLTPQGVEYARKVVGGLESIELACMDAMPAGGLASANGTNHRFLDEFERRLEDGLQGE